MAFNPEIVPAARAAAKKYKIPVPTVIGIFRQESAGVLTAEIVQREGGVQVEPIVRHEGHYFYKRLAGAARTLAVKMGLASPKAGAIKNPASQQNRWKKLIWPGMDINESAEIESCSWGGPQVMGAHWKRLGFSSPKAMLTHLRKGAKEHLDVFMRYCDKFELIDELQNGDIEGFVRGYNGPGNVAAYSASARKHIAWALAKYGTATDEKKIVGGVPVTNVKDARENRTYLRMGIMNDARVREAQALLVRHGYALNVDGDFGRATRDAVKEFQREKGITVDGKIGPQTWSELNVLRLDPEERPGIPGIAETLHETQEGTQGAVTAGAGAIAGGGINATKDTVQSAIDGLSPVAGYGSTWIDYIYTGLTVLATIITIGGLAWYAYGYIKARRIDKKGVDSEPSLMNVRIEDGPEEDM